MTAGANSAPARDIHRLRADLDWLGRCPPLFQLHGCVGNANALLQQSLLARPDWLTSITERHIEATVEDRDRRLGRYIENLVTLMLSCSPHLEVITRNLPIRDQGRTLGELDMLVYDHHRQRLMHWELTIKFYLGLPSGAWPGPNPADRLEGKAGHLFSHQFPLIRHDAARRQLLQEGWHVDEQYLFSAGRLFYPWQRPRKPPPAAAPGHWHGFWWPVDTIRHLAGPWWPLGKEAWLSGPARGVADMSDNAHAPLAPAELADYVQSARRPVMVWHDRDKTRQPGFVIPADWPTS